MRKLTDGRCCGRKPLIYKTRSSAELACRIFEGFNGIVRPSGLTAAQALEIVRKEDPEVLGRVMNATRKAAEYLRDCINDGKRPS